MSACRLFPGARLELRLTQGQSHRSPLGREAGGSGNPGKVGACLFFVWVSKTRALQEEELVGANAVGVL